MKDMKTYMLRNMMVVVLLGLAVMQAGAVDYKNRYRGVQNQEHRVQTGGNLSSTVQATAPQAGFQSTGSAIVSSGSSFSSNPVIGADGTASGVGTLAVESSEEKLRGDWVIEPGEDDEEFPIGDAALPLMLLAGIYVSVRAFLNKRVMKG